MFSIFYLFNDPIIWVISFASLVIAIGLHEFSHVLAAYLQGDQTGKLMGRLTLNPLAHLDRNGTIMMLIIGIGYGKPAPFNPYNLKFRKWGSALVAAAGPISNTIMMTIFGYLYFWLAPDYGQTNLLIKFLGAGTFINAALAVFNLLPINPLDGSHILRAVLLPDNTIVVWLDRYGFYLLLFLLFFSFIGGGSDILGSYISNGAGLLLHAVGLGSIFN